ATGLGAGTPWPACRSDARTPRADVSRRGLAAPWAVEGLVWRRVVAQAGARSADTTDGVRVVEADGRWVMVRPDAAEAVTHLWAEGPDDASAQALLDEWSAVVDSAGR